MRRKDEDEAEKDSNTCRPIDDIQVEDFRQSWGL